MRTGYNPHPVVYFDNRITRPSDLQFFEIVNRMGVHPVLIFKKCKPDGLVIRLGRGGVLLK